MIGLDTNVLVRCLVQDDPVQSQRATAWIEDASARGEKLYLCSMVLCELVWVLESCYGVLRSDIADTLERILMTSQFEIEHRDSAWAALAEFRTAKADFSDCLVGRIHRRAGCEVTATFDRATRSLPTFTLL